MNWNYIAGFFDGEGTLGKYSKSGYKIGITQSSKKVLEEIQIFTGLGHIHFIKKRKSHWQNAWLYYIAKQEDVYFFLNKILSQLKLANMPKGANIPIPYQITDLPYIHQIIK